MVENCHVEQVLRQIVGEAPAIQELKAVLRTYCHAEVPVHLRGESGTGKDLVARCLHQLSARREGPFVALNCAALPDPLLESELFGHAKGSFTGASAQRKGKFLLADTGTIFLDEVAELSLAAQAKLLRVVDCGELYSLGCDRPRRVDCRIISATHKDLAQEVAAGRFRHDLYYRLNVLEVQLPPLRARGEDIRLLATLFLQQEATRLGKPLRGFSEAVMVEFMRRHWLGNVRELQNHVARAALIATGEVIDKLPRQGPFLCPTAEEPLPGLDLAGRVLSDRYARLSALERDLISEALRRTGGNLSEASRLLGITRVRLRRRAERLGVSVRRVVGP